MASPEDLMKFKVSELKEIAQKEKIDLGEAAKKDDIVNVISNSMSDDRLSVYNKLLEESSESSDETPTKDSGAEIKEPTQATSKSNGKIKVGDTVIYSKDKHTRRTSEVYEVHENSVVILTHEGTKKHIAISKVELQ